MNVNDYIVENCVTVVASSGIHGQFSFDIVDPSIDKLWFLVAIPDQKYGFLIDRDRNVYRASPGAISNGMAGLWDSKFWYLDDIIEPDCDSRDLALGLVDKFSDRV